MRHQGTNRRGREIPSPNQSPPPIPRTCKPPDFTRGRKGRKTHPPTVLSQSAESTKHSQRRERDRHQDKPGSRGDRRPGLADAGGGELIEIKVAQARVKLGKVYRRERELVKYFQL
ncbi:voltage-dependent L-type calcium channel subunit alpha-1C [Striga asiatica]|uniref:Voltage-dependent L-type calcium channel subunit alpha-1C n=1 Tax=Striga asiatica TaxID=4170 RepID=A0A5A7RKW4_STRAF|nr:voltage-dependent L-type calcium channel subunit alpha-1C [Striga asiatica]